MSGGALGRILTSNTLSFQWFESGDPQVRSLTVIISSRDLRVYVSRKIIISASGQGEGLANTASAVRFELAGLSVMS